jgi:DNA-binding transcriptional regulator YdaS (Cro superfamily)
MRTDEAITYFGSQVKLAKALAMAQPSIAQWGDFPPAIRQVQIERLTNGGLKAEPECYRPQAQPA